MTDSIIGLLAKLDDAQARLDTLKLAVSDSKAKVLTPEIQAELDAIDVEFAPAIETTQAIIDEVTAQVKQAVSNHGATVKGEYLQAVYSKPRVSWDTKALDGFMVAHPELKQLRKVGKPSVSIRKV